MNARLHFDPWPFATANAGQMGVPQGWPPEAMAQALARAATEGCRVDAVRIRGWLRDVFAAHDVHGTVYVHVIVQPGARKATRLHALLRMGSHRKADIDARGLVRYLKAMAEIDLRGADLRAHGGVCLENPPTHFELLNPWIAQVWPAHPQPQAQQPATTTTQPKEPAAQAPA